MKKALSLFVMNFKMQFRSLTPIKIKTYQQLEDHLNDCFTLEDIAKLKSILRLCNEDFSQLDQLNLIRNIDYRKQLIKYCNTNLKNERYAVTEIYSFLNQTGSYAVCDAILLHCKKNKQFYLSHHNEFSPLQNLDIFERMVTKRKSFIYPQFKLNQKEVC